MRVRDTQNDTSTFIIIPLFPLILFYFVYILVVFPVLCFNPIAITTSIFQPLDSKNRFFIFLRLRSNRATLPNPTKEPLLFFQLPRRQSHCHFTPSVLALFSSCSVSIPQYQWPGRIKRNDGCVVSSPFANMPAIWLHDLWASIPSSFCSFLQKNALVTESSRAHFFHIWFSSTHLSLTSNMAVRELRHPNACEV